MFNYLSSKPQIAEEQYFLLLNLPGIREACLDFTGGMSLPTANKVCGWFPGFNPQASDLLASPRFPSTHGRALKLHLV